jgi:hypothetical protein
VDCTALHCTALHCTALDSTALHKAQCTLHRFYLDTGMEGIVRGETRRIGRKGRLKEK